MSESEVFLRTDRRGRLYRDHSGMYIHYGATVCLMSQCAPRHGSCTRRVSIGSGGSESLGLDCTTSVLLLRIMSQLIAQFPIINTSISTAMTAKRPNATLKWQV
jgi:hypothetical protein